jgi:hypothetical protein
MTFTQVEQNIDLSHGKRIPQTLNEMMWCQPLAQYLNKNYGTSYQHVNKDYELDKLGIDIIMTETDEYQHPLYIQLTYAKEYNMSPVAENKFVDLSGKGILEAIERKCTQYTFRGINTHKMILLIQGVLPIAYVDELISDKLRVSEIENIDCFDGIYYISDKVYPLKEVKL